MLREIEYDGGHLKDCKALCSGRGWSVPVHQDRDSAIRVQGIDVPWLLSVSSELDVLNTGNGDQMYG